MNIVNVTDEKYKDVWDNFLIVSGRGSYLQSWQWGSVMEKTGAEIFRIAVIDKDENGSAQLRAIVTAWTQKTFLGKEMIVIPQGPILDFMGKDSYSIIVAIFEHIENLAKERKIVFSRINAPILSSEITYLGSYFASLKKRVKVTKKRLIGEKIFKLSVSPEPHVFPEKFNFNLKNAQDRFELGSTNDCREIAFFLNALGGKREKNDFWPLAAEHINQNPAVVPLDQKTRKLLPLKFYYATRKGSVLAGIAVIYFGLFAIVAYESISSEGIAPLYLIYHAIATDAHDIGLTHCVVESDKSAIAEQLGGTKEEMSDTCDIVYKKLWYKLAS